MTTPSTPPAPHLDAQSQLLMRTMKLRFEILSLDERIRGLGMTPKHLREERHQTLKLELAGKIEEHDNLVDEYNALIRS